jgi:hypothetical protein
MKFNCLTWLSLAIILALFAQTGCREQAKVPDMSKADMVTKPRKAQITEGTPRITFEETVYDFGEVAAGKKYTGQFKFTNTGNGVLKITDVKRCCGAVVALDKKELAPGESSTLKVDYDTGRASGLVLRELRVFSNDETNPKVTLTIKARVVVRVDYQPQRIYLLPNKENAGCPKITITSLDKQPFSITAFQSTGESITADVDPSVEATRFVLEPKVDLEKLQKQSSGLVAISLTHPELDKVNIRFITKQRFQLTPSSVLLINPLPQEPSINKVSVVSNYNEDFEIESTSSEKGLAKVISQQPIAGGYRLEIEITPPPPDETGSFTDVVNVRLKGGETLAIKCYVRYSRK